MSRFKLKLQKNEVTFGTWIQIPHPSIVEIISQVDKDSGYNMDWICVDLEHGIIDIESMTNIFRAIENEGYAPLARIPKNDYVWIHRVLDAGAEGLVIPMIKNKNDIDFVCEQALYPPLGKRSFGYSRSNGYGTRFNHSVRHENARISIIPQIEHIDAINNLEEILDHPYIGASFVGPLDLMGSMGLIGKEGREEFEKALDKYVKVSNAFHIPPGRHIVEPVDNDIKEAIKNGYKMIAIGLDVTFLKMGVEKAFGELAN